uniref:Uncharacterized protein n=1 Tax=Solanum lycopersicum TaxID=4081 RepID=A0A3Q7I5H4_SOLLC
MNIVPSLMKIVVLQLPPKGVGDSNEGVQLEPNDDIDEQALSGQNSDDDFVNEPPPLLKLTGQQNNDNAGQGPQYFTNSDNINNNNAGQGPQYFTSPVVSENHNQGLFDDEKVECDESSNDGSKEVFQFVVHSCMIAYYAPFDHKYYKNSCPSFHIAHCTTYHEAFLEAYQVYSNPFDQIMD